MGGAAALAAVPVEDQSTSRTAAPPPAIQGQDQTVQDQTVQGQTVQGQNTQLFFELQQIRSELERLHGLAEEQAHEIEKLRRIQRDQYVDLDKRLSEIGGSSEGVAAIATTQAPASAPTAQVVNGVVVDAQLPQAPVPEPSRTQTPSVQAGGASTVLAPGATVFKPDSADERGDYTRAFDLMKAREFDSSIIAFKQTLIAYPEGEYAANSQYWLGELYLQKDDLDGARAQFKTVVERYPAHQKVPDSLYKLGVVNHREGSTNRALEYFDDVVDRYPGAPAAGLAQSYAAELR